MYEQGRGGRLFGGSGRVVLQHVTLSTSPPSTIWSLHNRHCSGYSSTECGVNLRILLSGNVTFTPYTTFRTFPAADQELRQLIAQTMSSLNAPSDSRLRSSVLASIFGSCGPYHLTLVRIISFEPGFLYKRGVGSLLLSPASWLVSISSLLSGSSLVSYRYLSMHPLRHRPSNSRLARLSTFWVWVL